jgi:hypothetical protein
MAEEQKDNQNSIANSEAAAKANEQAMRDAEKLKEEQAKAAAKAEEQARKALEKETANVHPTIIESSEVYRSRMFAQAMMDAEDRQIDETVPGGVYRDFAGRYVNAKGELIDVKGADKAQHSGELRDKVKVS